MTDLEQSKYQVRMSLVCILFTSNHFLQNCEWRISIYGRNVNEWDKLAKWVVNNKIFSHNVRWLVQIPRLYDIYKQNGSVNTFEDVVRSMYANTSASTYLMTYGCRYFPTSL